jgi:hypothetical protein
MSYKSYEYKGKVYIKIGRARAAFTPTEIGRAKKRYRSQKGGKK